MDYDLLLDVIEIFAGAYLLFMAFKMKTTGSLTDNGLISKGLDLNKAPEPQNYIKVMFPWSCVVGVLLIVCGVASRILSTTDYYDKCVLATTSVSAILVIGYGFIAMKSQKNFLEPKGGSSIKKNNKKF